MAEIVVKYGEGGSPFFEIARTMSEVFLHFFGGFPLDLATYSKNLGFLSDQEYVFLLSGSGIEYLDIIDFSTESHICILNLKKNSNLLNP